MSNFTIVINLGQRGRTACKFANFLRTQKISWKVKSFFSFSFISSSYAFLLIYCEGENRWKWRKNDDIHLFNSKHRHLNLHIFWKLLFTTFHCFQLVQIVVNADLVPNYHMWNFSSEDSSPFFPKFWYISLQTAESLPFLKKVIPRHKQLPRLTFLNHLHYSQLQQMNTQCPHLNYRTIDFLWSLCHILSPAMSTSDGLNK